ncbi:uncharacterized protein [Aquarana catesbeiana]|uniref:uncharacterized protein isoform X2 n=1 Tax=Aquarana catesbeiana TaxID=8400 RepID=UPI003CC93DD5
MEGTSNQTAQRKRSEPQGAGHVPEAASSPAISRGRMRSTVTWVSGGGESAAAAQISQRRRSPSRRATHGSGSTPQRAGRERQRRPTAPRAGPSGVQTAVVQRAEVSDRSEGELSGSERDQEQGTTAAVDSGMAADGPSPGQPVGQVSGIGTRRIAAGGYLPGLDVERCLGNVAGWIQRSVSKATWDAYSKVWQEWLTCLQSLDIDPEGPEVTQAVLYFINLGFEGEVSASAIDKKLAGLAFLFKLQGRRDYTKEFWVKQAVKGYRKEHRMRDGRRPVSFTMLQGLFFHISSICVSEYESALALRVSELVSPSKRAQGGLQWEDFEGVFEGFG